MRRKQTSIRSSRSALSHRYLRYISWISWVHRSQSSTSWVSTPCRSPRTHCFRGSSYPCCRCHPESKENISWFFPRKRKHPSSLLRAPLVCCSSCAALPPRSHICCPTIHRRPVCRLLLTSSLRPSTNKKMRAHSIAPRPRSPRLSNVLKKA